MGEAREVLDRLTDAVFTIRDLKAIADLYAENAVAVTPDQGEIVGRERIVEWHKQFMDAFPDARYESERKYESGNTAIDEGAFIGTHTGPLAGPSGDMIQATGREVDVRACDIGDVEDGVVVAHRFYFDQMSFLGQLGLLPDSSV
jgi:ketosteroid isomerase-like protein